MRFSDSLLLIGLTGLAGAHPSRRAPNPSPMSKRGLDLEAFKLAPMAEYVSQEEVPEDVSAKVVTKRADYTETASDLVKATYPKAEFRMVDDHYVGTNGIAHVNFKQTVNGIDIDNADFNVNVSGFGMIV
jgi:extracellular elastinolytic metalloproteinase